MWKPELLAPAKNLERLKVAITYGADAVYVGGQRYGLRARADNLTDTELTQAAAFAHAHGAKLYVTLNAFLHDDDFAGLEAYCGFLQQIGIDALIVSDLGVLRVVRRSCDIDIHLSTQASCLNVAAARLWKSFGVRRLILGRELSVTEGGIIRQEADIDVEMFVHGAMCMAFSGHCTISNFTAGRDSNRGGCSQSCRFPYRLNLQDRATSEAAHAASSAESCCATDVTVPFMSSTDLWGIHQIDDFFRQRICSLKIEGRMKSSFYVATTCKAYRQLIDSYAAGTLTEALLSQIATDLRAVPHRDYASGSLLAPAGPETVFPRHESINVGAHKYLGVVLDSTPHELILRIVEPLSVGDTIELLPAAQRPIRWQIDSMAAITGRPVDQMRKDSVVRLPKVEALQTALSAITANNIARLPISAP